MSLARIKRFVLDLFPVRRRLASNERWIGWIDASWPLYLTVSSNSEECDLRDEESESDSSDWEWDRKGTGRETDDLSSSETSCPRIRTRNHLLKSKEDDRPARDDNIPTTPYPETHRSGETSHLKIGVDGRLTAAPLLVTQTVITAQGTLTQMPNCPSHFLIPFSSINFVSL